MLNIAVNIELNKVWSIELLQKTKDILIKNILFTLRRKREISTINLDTVILDLVDVSAQRPKN